MIKSENFENLKKINFRSCDFIKLIYQMKIKIKSLKADVSSSN